MIDLVLFDGFTQTGHCKGSVMKSGGTKKRCREEDTPLPPTCFASESVTPEKA